MPAERLLIVNADDFGITRGVNHAIIDCHQIGSITSTTLMVNMAATEHAVCLASKNLQLGVGLHFNLTLGRPVSPAADVPSLIQHDGIFYPRRAMERRLLLGRVRREHVTRELEAQYRRFLELRGMPTHLDSHQHVHVFPLVFDALATLAENQKLPLRMPWRWPGEKSTNWTKRMRTSGMQVLLGLNRRRWRGRISSNTGLCSLFDLTYKPEEIQTSLYRRLLQKYEGGVVELMVHPAYVDAALRGLTRIADFSAAESRFLRTTALQDLASELDFKLATYACVSS